MWQQKAEKEGKQSGADDDGDDDER